MERGHEEINELKDRVESLELRCDDNEQYHQRLCLRFFLYSIEKFFKHITNYNNYKLRYNTTKTMPQGAKYYVYPAAVLKVIKKYIKLHVTITEKKL